MLKQTIVALGISGALLSGVFAMSMAFSDVPMDHWAHNSIMWANETGLMTGPGNMPGKFDPAGVVNRAQLATVMERFYMDMKKEMGTGTMGSGDTQMQVHMDAMKKEMDMMKADMAAMKVKMDMISSGQTTQTVDTALMATLNGAQEVPAVQTSATGTGTFTLKGNNLEYSVTVQGLSGAVTSAHFHMGMSGASGDVVKEVVFTGTSATGTWMNLTEQQKADLLAGKYYVNVHTSANPNGEIRGQVMKK